MSALPKPTPKKWPLSDSIPTQLKNCSQWVCWRLELDKNGKPTKTPYSARTGARCDITSAESWSSFEDALKGMARFQFDGIGFAVSSSDEFSGGDLDHCRDPLTGSIAPWALDIISRVNSYTEVSPSGTGIRFFVIAASSVGSRCSSAWEGGKVEMFSRDRYLTVTGQHLPGTPLTVNDRQAEWQTLHQQIFGTLRDKRPTEINVAAVPLDLDDEELLRIIRRSTQGSRFTRLNAGDISDYHNDHSSADLAFCNLLAFWTGRDAQRMDAFVRRSALMRPKWDSKRGDTTYGAQTIERAIAQTAQVYSPPALQRSPLRQPPKHIPPSPPEPPSEQPPPQAFALSELGNSERLVRDLHTQARYSHQLDTWFIFDGVRYQPDEDGEIHRRAKQSTRSIPSEAAELSRGASALRERAAEESISADERKDLLSDAVTLDKLAAKLSTWGLKSESCRAINAVVTLAQSHEDVIVSPAQLDADPWLLNVQNGVLDMRAGKLLAHSPDRLITKLAPVTFDRAATCPRWLEYLSDVFPGQQRDVVPFLQRAVGYSLTGITTEECFFVLVGGGRNGKGTLIKIISALLGSYAAQADFGSFIQRKDDSSPREDIAAMRGAYFVAAQESRERATFAEALIKNLTGGDTVRARRLHENGFEFTPRFKIWLATNHKPRIVGTDVGIWSRIRLIPFTECFEGREDKGLKEALLSELSGILNWAIEGCLKWQRQGLGSSDSVTAANTTYRKECDQLQTFLDDCCQRGEYFSVGAHELYLAYKKWAGEGGEEFVTETAFGLRMAEKGCPKERKSNGVRYQKLGLTLHQPTFEGTLHDQ